MNTIKKKYAMALANWEIDDSVVKNAIASIPDGIKSRCILTSPFAKFAVYDAFENNIVKWLKPYLISIVGNPNNIIINTDVYYSSNNFIYVAEIDEKIKIDGIRNNTFMAFDLENVHEFIKKLNNL